MFRASKPVWARRSDPARLSLLTCVRSRIAAKWAAAGGPQTARFVSKLQNFHACLGQQRRDEGVVVVILTVPNLGDPGRCKNLRAVDADIMGHVRDTPLHGTSSAR